MELHRTRHWVLTYEEPLHLVRATRTNAPYDAVGDVERSMEEFLTVGRRFERRGLKLLLDVREGPLRNDDAFEEVMTRYRTRLFADFAALAILVKTAVGKLQVARITRQEGRERPIFTDETAALAFLSKNADSRK
ncbi:MAG: hypothetical protein ACXVEF_44695 [Polyangiales bacterium]